jgi:hypothetical protein
LLRRNRRPVNVPFLFDNLIRTDGHTIELIYSVKESEKLTDLAMDDLFTQDMTLAIAILLLLLMNVDIVFVFQTTNGIPD